MREKRTDRIIALGNAAVEIFNVNHTAGFAQKIVRRADQLFQVFNAILPVFIGCIQRLQGARIKQVTHDFRQRQTLGRNAHAFDQPNKLRHRHMGSTACAASTRGLPQRYASSGRDLLQILDGFGTDTTRWKVHYAQQRVVIFRIVDQAQIRHRMLHLGALKKAQPAIHPIRNARIEQAVLEHSRLRIRAIQNRDVIKRHAVIHRGLHAVKHEARFFAVAVALKNANRLAVPLIGPQLFSQPPVVVANQRVGGLKNAAVTAIILLKLDDFCRRKIMLKALHIRNFGSSKSVNRLIVVTHRQHRRVRACQ